jgi:hypothetical protein
MDVGYANLPYFRSFTDVTRYFLATQEQVQSSKDLDLPLRHELLAQFRYEVGNTVLEVSNQDVRSCAGLSKRGIS